MSDKLRGQVESLKDVISSLLNPGGQRVEEFLDGLTDASGNPIKLSNALGVVGVIDQHYHQPTGGPFQGAGFFPSDQFFAPIFADKDAGREVTQYLAGCANRLREARPDLASRYSGLFS
jgi:hypothetical protein